MPLPGARVPSGQMEAQPRETHFVQGTWMFRWPKYQLRYPDVKDLRCKHEDAHSGRTATSGGGTRRRRSGCIIIHSASGKSNLRSKNSGRKYGTHTRPGFFLCFGSLSFPPPSWSFSFPFPFSLEVDAAFSFGAAGISKCDNQAQFHRGRHKYQFRRKSRILAA